jgi:hypothetical protein
MTQVEDYREDKFFYWKKINVSDWGFVIPDRYNVRVFGAKESVCKVRGL